METVQDLVRYCVNHVHFNVCLHTGRVALLDNIFKLGFILHYNNVYTLGSAHPGNRSLHLRFSI